MGCKQLLSSNSYVQYPRYLGYYLGVNETLLLSIYCDIDNYCAGTINDFDGWFYAKQSDVFIESGLSEKQQTLAIKHLKELNIISAKKAGNPSITYYKIDENVLENVLNIAYSQYLSKKRQKVATSNDKKSPLSNDVSHSLHINNNNLNNNTNKEPSQEAQATVANSRRNFRNKVKPLEDLLNSGKYLDEQKKEKKKSQAQKNIESCLAMIQSTDYSDTTKSLLTEYFLFISDIKQAKTSEDKLKVTNKPNIWETKLTKLQNLVNNGYDVDKLIQQSLDQKKYVFFPLQSEGSKNKTSRHECFTETIHSTPIEEARKAMAEKKAKGVKVY